jgi:hypothetical protein
VSVRKHGGHAYAKELWIGDKSVNARYTPEEARKLVGAITKLLDLGYPEIDVAHYSSKVRKSDGAKQVTVNSSVDPLPFMTLAGPGLLIDLMYIEGHEYYETWDVMTLEIFPDHIVVDSGAGRVHVGTRGHAMHENTMVFFTTGGGLIRVYPGRPAEANAA